ncbi:MAG: transglutaminase-like domain-containing protein [Pseudomonadota bacterium]|nr:transglutaminase-like domain-containing protein [Pseudomonadota bacterium]
MRALVVLEALFVASFLAVAALALFDAEPPLPPIDAAALSVGPTEERWQGIFVQDAHVGYAVTREAATADGGRVYSGQSAFRIAALGTSQQIATAGTAITGPDGKLRTFDFLLSAPTKLTGRGDVRDGSIHVEIAQDGEVRTIDVPVREPPVLSITLAAQFRGRTLVPGMRFQVPYFDPITMTNADATLTVESTELLANGESGYWVKTQFGGVEARRLVDAAGDTLREESAMGLRTERMTRDEAMAIDGGEPPDLVALSAAELKGTLKNARDTKVVGLRIAGVEPERIPSEPPLQTRVGDLVTISVPLLQELGHLPLAVPESSPELSPTLSIPSTHPEIVARAREIVGDAPDRLVAARRIHDFVFDYLQKVPTIGVPDGLTVLRSGRGDCNEHTALFVSLARAAGIPARIAAGLVYSDRLGNAFYYHAWPEVELGGPTGWVPVDPTFGQFPADATHLKVVTGDLDKQVQIMALMGRIRLELIEAR